MRNTSAAGTGGAGGTRSRDRRARNIWHSQLPGWAGSLSSRDDLLSAMRSHIAREAGHFAGKIAYWDVVNEAAPALACAAP